MRRALRENGLSVAFGAIFLVSLVGQAISGRDAVNHEQWLHHGDPVSLWHYVSSAVFWADVMENWQSEYLQFTLYIFATIYLVQKGSNESKTLDHVGRRPTRNRSSAPTPSPTRRAGRAPAACAPRSTPTPCCS